MAAPSKPVVYWKPAPFAVYAPDRRRIWLEHALALCCLLVFAAALAPRPADRDAALLVPVAYHRLQLEQRAPAVVALNLPGGDYSVEPQSLGYFTPGGKFVYTAAVARGLIYGRSGDTAYIMELAAPEDSRAFLEFHLDQIRAGVLEQNRLANLLVQARRAAQEIDDEQERAVIKAYRELGAGALHAGAAEAEALLRQAQSQPSQAQHALARYSQRQAALKQRFYACRRAKVEVAGLQAMLQLALARLPEQPSSELLSLGDRQLVADSLEQSLAQQERAWRERLRSVQAELDSAPGEPPAVQPATGPAGAAHPAPAAPEAVELAGAMRAARRAILLAEAAELRQCLDKLAQVRSRALTGRPPGWTDLPQLAFMPQELAQPSLAALPGYGMLLGLDGQPTPTLGLLRQLACRFESRLPAGGEPAPVLPQQGFPFELPYGLLAVDLAERRAGFADAGGRDGEAGPSVMAQSLEAMLADPAAYGLASLDLAYVRCLAWYAALPANPAAAVPGG